MRGRAVLAIVAVLLAGCSAGPSAPATPRRLPAAEPATSPVPATAPAGRVLAIGDHPEGMVFDPTTGLLAVAVRGPDRLLLVDGSTGTTVRAVALPGHARHLQLAAPGGPVLVPDENSDDLVEVALPGGTTSSVRVGRSPHDAAAVGGGEVLVGDELGGTLSLVSGSRVVKTFRTQTQPGGVAYVGNGLAGVVDVGVRTVSTYDVPARRRTAVLPAGNGPTHLVPDARGRLLVADTRGNAVLVFTARPLRASGAFRLPGTPYGLAFDPGRQVLWVTLTATNEVVGLADSGGALREVARFPTVQQPDTVAVDPRTGRLFVAGATTGQLQVIDPAG